MMEERMKCMCVADGALVRVVLVPVLSRDGCQRSCTCKFEIGEVPMELHRKRRGRVQNCVSIRAGRGKRTGWGSTVKVAGARGAAAA